MTKHRYTFDLAAASLDSPKQPPSGVGLRQPTTADAEALAVLMLDAYRDTIDFDGETIVEARSEVAGWYDRHTFLDPSVVAVDAEKIVSASLLSKPGDVPIVGYVMTAAQSKNRGLGSLVVGESLRALQAAGYTHVEAWITKGNIPSEAIFRRAGFVTSDD